jgi:membrane-anchored protein YejM (alkaline phosphatase superfamily)
MIWLLTAFISLWTVANAVLEAKFTSKRGNFPLSSRFATGKSFQIHGLAEQGDENKRRRLQTTPKYLEVCYTLVSEILSISVLF